MDYALTPMGATLHETIRSLVAWTEEHQNAIAAARAAYDARVQGEKEAAEREAAERDSIAREALTALR